MTRLLKLNRYTFQPEKFRVVKSEIPLLTFNRICFGLIHNDWVLVISSAFTLVVSIVSFAIQHGR